MPFLAGPAVPLSGVVSAMMRSHRVEPFDYPAASGGSRPDQADPRAALIEHILVLLDQLTALLRDLGGPVSEGLGAAGGSGGGVAGVGPIADVVSPHHRSLGSTTQRSVTKVMAHQVSPTTRP